MSSIQVTIEDLINYLGIVSAESLAVDTINLIEKAKDLILYLTQGNLDVKNRRHIDVFKKAVCAQLEYWMEVSKETIITGNTISGYSLGDLSMNFQENKTNEIKHIAPRTMQYLNTEGLLYRGNIRC